MNEGENSTSPAFAPGPHKKECRYLQVPGGKSSPLMNLEQPFLIVGIKPADLRAFANITRRFRTSICCKCSGNNFSAACAGERTPGSAANISEKAGLFIMVISINRHFTHTRKLNEKLGLGCALPINAPWGLMRKLVTSGSQPPTSGMGT